MSCLLFKYVNYSVHFDEFSSGDIRADIRWEFSMSFLMLFFNIVIVSICFDKNCWRLNVQSAACLCLSLLLMYSMLTSFSHACMCVVAMIHQSKMYRHDNEWSSLSLKYVCLIWLYPPNFLEVTQGCETSPAGLSSFVDSVIPHFSGRSVSTQDIGDMAVCLVWIWRYRNYLLTVLTPLVLLPLPLIIPGPVRPGVSLCRSCVHVFVCSCVSSLKITWCTTEHSSQRCESLVCTEVCLVVLSSFIHVPTIHCRGFEWSCRWQIGEKTIIACNQNVFVALNVF